jgi:hypothetical protein
MSALLTYLQAKLRLVAAAWAYVAFGGTLPRRGLGAGLAHHALEKAGVADPKLVLLALRCLAGRAPARDAEEAQHPVVEGLRAARIVHPFTRWSMPMIPAPGARQVA